MKLSWQHVAVIALVLAAVVTLAALGQDTTALLGLGTLLLAGIGLIAGQQQTIRDNTNGTMGKLLTMVEQLSHRLADSQPATPSPTGSPIVHLHRTDEVDNLDRTAEVEHRKAA
jgi:hypothetical protein